MWRWRTVFVTACLVGLAAVEGLEQKTFQCSITSFACRGSEEKCIPLAWKCDNVKDCHDGSDEDPLLCPAKPCYKTELRCNSGKCIPERWKCDGEPDCDDQSDENPEECAQMCGGDGSRERWECGSGQCIPLDWRCDNEVDCDDDTDEKDCPYATCTSEQFTCASGKCISKRWHCDGDNDCGENDASDEVNCPNETCSINQVTCPDASCIDKSMICDGIEDCIDGLDEHDCPNNTCRADEYACLGGFPCIRRDWLCDGDADCREGDDEGQEMCLTHCPEGMFMCGDQSCINEHLKCNGYPECSDGLDEQNCSPSCNETDEFDCGGHCIPMQLVCNGNDDCGNSKDEPTDGTCGRNECENYNGGCSQVCVDTPAGHYCKCNKGFMLINSTQCDDIDECLEPGICSQVCRNFKGGHKCECVRGYARDRHNHSRCKAMEGHASLLFAHFTDIRKISLDHQEITAIVNETKGATALDFVFKTGMIFWTDAKDKRIYKAPIDEGSKKVVVISNDVTTVDGLAVDWLYNHIYWTNTDTDTIEVADFNGDMRKTLIRSVLEEPRAIAVYPSEGWMFWTDWGQQAKIERAGMDGKLREAIVTRGIRWPNALTLDLVLRKVYWCDSKFHSIYSANFDGSNRRTVLHSSEYLPHPFSITLFEDTMYWTDWRKEAIFRANKFTGKDIDTIAPSHATPMTVHVYHSYRQPNGTNHCTPLNGLCTHLCLPAPQTNESTCKVTCACPDGLVLMSDGLTCESEGDSQPDSQPDSHPYPVSHLETTASTDSQPDSQLNTVNHPATTTLTNSQPSTVNHPETTASADSQPDSQPSTVSQPDMPAPTDSELTSEPTPLSHPATPAPTATLPYSPTEELSSTVLTEVQEAPPHESVTEGESDEGSVAIAAILAALGVLCVASALAYVIYRYFRKRSVHSMNFDNPVYKKTTTEDGFHLAGQQRNACSRATSGGPQYQHRQYGVTSPEDSLEPLTNGSNNFV
ncbi:very low-density lipoprotein receptor-like isoform X3 [Portunus trituberculatus]|uniref:very low-density lipoprotein receptor-like isoform X3 n=1 Tax=Portunus trituberculatus TaxID=210409 RepID=UPI001E1CD25E|nr:very low-density lipoprotein receptor-like isoform X3 [Portunus trituberculatus]